MNFRRAMLPALLLAGASGQAGPFSRHDEGVPITAGVFRAWIADARDYHHPANSGGFARDDFNEPTSPSQAIAGRPAGADTSQDDNLAHVLSLGGGGSIVLTFDTVIADGPGPDFAVFENGFRDASPRPGDTNDYVFAEFAFVEVGSTTSAWARFPCTSLGTGLVYNTSGLSSGTWHYGSLDATLVDGLAGKHSIAWGTPFDLAALTNEPAVLSGAVDLRDINCIRLTDVIGDGSATDRAGRPIFDPYFRFDTGGLPPASVTDGFDLRAIGVINTPAAALGPGREVAWYAGANAGYQVQYCDDLAAGQWHNLGAPVPGNSATNLVADPCLTAPARTYRVLRIVGP